ncbi:hypothetical protein H5410_003721 [Solanum commersonii]|uniref:Uncharacterized protein n=1 Tax=Solanum commersonii TaxID=4109 RepID=A0A9J6B5Y6_SOLCO|nr:hypothetical protein H5410_003721 [Solanum commersonii]
MDSRNASISRNLYPHCNHLESRIEEFSTCEGWCVSWDLQLGSPPIGDDGEKNNKGLILLGDAKDFERTLKVIGGIFFKILIILRMCILEMVLIVEGKLGCGAFWRLQEEKVQSRNLLVPFNGTLPLVYKFEDEEPLPPKKEKLEKEIDKCFVDMDIRISPMLSEKLSDCLSLMTSNVSRLWIFIRKIFVN